MIPNTNIKLGRKINTPGPDGVGQGFPTRCPWVLLHPPCLFLAPKKFFRHIPTKPICQPTERNVVGKKERKKEAITLGNRCSK